MSRDVAFVIIVFVVGMVTGTIYLLVTKFNSGNSPFLTMVENFCNGVLLLGVLGAGILFVCVSLWGSEKTIDMFQRLAWFQTSDAVRRTSYRLTFFIIGIVALAIIFLVLRE